jgi:hypothetical protein
VGGKEEREREKERESALWSRIEAINSHYGK